MHVPGQRPGHPHQLTGRAGDDLQVHPVPVMFPGVERPVGGHPVDGDERPVEDQVRMPGRGGQGIAAPRRPGRQQADGLGNVPPRGRRADAEPGGQSGEGLALAQGADAGQGREDGPGLRTGGWG